MSEDWRGAASLLLSRFQVFLHAVRAREVTAEESELFELLNEWLDSEGDQDMDGLVNIFS
jgi:hypothetical protein